MHSKSITISGMDTAFQSGNRGNQVTDRIFQATDRVKQVADLYFNLTGKKYDRVKKQGERNDLTCGQNVQRLTTADAIASEHGISGPTVRFTTTPCGPVLSSLVRMPSQPYSRILPRT